MPLAREESFKSVIDPVTGEFKRPAAQFRNFISSTPNAKFPPEKGRYHLYVSYACPWGILQSNSPESMQLTPEHSTPNIDYAKTQRVRGSH